MKGNYHLNGICRMHNVHCDGTNFVLLCLIIFSIFMATRDRSPYDAYMNVSPLRYCVVSNRSLCSSLLGPLPLFHATVMDLRILSQSHVQCLLIHSFIHSVLSFTCSFIHSCWNVYVDINSIFFGMCVFSSHCHNSLTIQTPISLSLALSFFLTY